MENDGAFPRGVKSMKTTYSMLAVVALAVGGCRSADRRAATSPGATNDSAGVTAVARDDSSATPVAKKPKATPPKHRTKSGIADVACLYEQKPWLNLDAAGDRTPEGIRFRVFLDAGSGRGVLSDGTLHVEMYRVRRSASGGLERTLVSDWHYPTSELSPVRSKLLGMGYMVRLGWARKDLGGEEVEITARFEQPDGESVTSGTKRLRIPKFAF